MYTYLFMEVIHLAIPQKPTHSVVMKCNEHANEKPTVSGIQVPRVCANLPCYPSLRSGVCVLRGRLPLHCGLRCSHRTFQLQLSVRPTAVFPVHILFTHLKVCLWGHTQTPARTHAPFLPCFPAHLAVLSQKPHTRQCELVSSRVRERPTPDTTRRGPGDRALQTPTGRDTVCGALLKAYWVSPWPENNHHLVGSGDTEMVCSSCLSSIYIGTTQRAPLEKWGQHPQRSPGSSRKHSGVKLPTAYGTLHRQQTQPTTQLCLPAHGSANLPTGWSCRSHVLLWLFLSQFFSLDFSFKRMVEVKEDFEHQVKKLFDIKQPCPAKRQPLLSFCI